jgi:hypothetical protein
VISYGIVSSFSGQGPAVVQMFFGFHKRRGFFWLVELLFASRKSQFREAKWLVKR